MLNKKFLSKSGNNPRRLVHTTKSNHFYVAYYRNVDRIQTKLVNIPEAESISLKAQKTFDSRPKYSLQSHVTQKLGNLK